MKIIFDPILRKFRITENIGSGGGGGSTVPTNILFADLLTLYNAATMVPGWYNITDRADRGIVVQSISSSKLALNAIGIFLNADYQNVGNYSNVTFFGSQLGVWNLALTPALGDVVIWNGSHYRNATGSIGTAPNGDAVNWQSLPKTLTTNIGYITEADYIEYDFVNDVIFKREDRRGNIINDYLNLLNLNNFQWGCDNTKGFFVEGNSTINNMNSRGISIGINVLLGAILVQDNTNQGTFTFSSIKGVYQLTGQGTTTINLNTSIDVRGIELASNRTITIDPNGVTNGSKIINGIKSTAIHTFDITGLTTLDFTIAYIYIGIVNATSTNPTESINLFAHFPLDQPVRFYPASGLTLTFVHNIAANKPRCEGGVSVVLNGTKGDWVEFTKAADGFIYQTNIGTY